MKNIIQAIIILACSIVGYTASGQGEITISQLTNGISGSPVTGGAQDLAVFGVRADKAASATSDITSITIQLSSDPAGKFTNPRLYVSTNDNFNSSFDNPVGGLTITTNATSFTFAGTITSFGGNSTAETRFYFVVVDIDPAANGTTPTITPSISDTDITASTSVVANAFSGTTYSFTGITPNITSVGPGSSTCVGETITITGTGFSSPTVTINGVTATITSGPSSTSIDITAPGGAAIGTHVITVTNANSNNDNSAGYEIKPEVDLLKTVLPSNANPASGTPFNITINNTQVGVEYRVLRPSPPGTYTGYQNGNGGTLTFGPFSHTTPNTYIYTAYARSTNCGAEEALNQTASVTVAALQANAGMDIIICAGETITLGGNPTASGGTGFYNITWTSPTDPTYVSIESNPVVNPYTTTTYQVEVNDSDSDTDIDLITVTVKEAADEIDLGIDLTPDRISFNKNDGPVDLDYSNVGSTTHQSHIFRGDGVITSEEKFYPTFANIGENVITMDFTNTNDCITTITKTITVYDPSSFVTSLNSYYCPVGSDNFTILIPPSPAYPYNYVSFVDVTIQDSFGNPVPEGSNWSHAGQTVTINPGLMGADNYTILITYSKNNWEITGTVPGCPEVYTCFIPTFPFISTCIRYNCLYPVFGAVPRNVQEKVQFTIRENPKIAIRKPINSLPFETCLNSDSVRVEGLPIGGIWSGPGMKATSGNDNNPSFSVGDNGVAYFNPANANPGGFNVFTYTFQDEFGCSNSISDSIRVFNIPTIDFTVGNGCVDVPLPFQPTATIPPGVVVTNYLWNFNDNTVTDSTVLNSPTIHTYASSNTYDVTFATRTADGCGVSVEKEVQVGDIPDIDISWNNVCDQDPVRFVIRSDFFKSTPGLIDQVQWNFGDGAPDVNNSPTISDTIKFHLYSSLGNFPIQATLTSDLGCTRSKEITAFKVPKVLAVSDLNEYFEDFENANHGWLTGGTNSSWEWGIPDPLMAIGDDSQGGGSAWVTNLSGSYNANERSWVHSPCFDLSQIDRPVISLDYRLLIRERLDGVVLQINTNNTTNIESDWKNVGIVGSGKNWFNLNGIFANPGNQALLQSGWSGEELLGVWKEAIFALDDELPIDVGQRERVRFRFAFASLQQSASGDALPEGFGYDNVKIAERDRIVLLESFTNSGGSSGSSDPNRVFNEYINTEFLDESELVKIEYHVGIGGPGPDPLFLDNKEDANARAAYYGVTATPFALLDSKNGNLGTLFEEQKLVSADVTIDTIITHPSIGDSIRVIFTTKNQLPANTILHIVPVEKLIDTIAAQGANGEDVFRYVMKQMLPSALGTKFQNPIAFDEKDSVTVYWPPVAYVESELAIIAFLQNEQTRDVYQAKILSIPNYIPPINIITGVEPAFINQIRVYPNPANDEVTIELPSVLMQQLPVKLFDTYGREVYTSTFGTGVRTKTIATKNLTAGIYMLQVNSKEGSLLRKKVLVVH